MKGTFLSVKRHLLTVASTFVLLLFAQNAAAITYTVIDGDKNDPGNNEGLPKLFDGDFTTKWGNSYSLGTPQFAIFKVDAAITPEWYCLVEGNDTGSYTDRNWKTWKIYGANFASDEEAKRDAEWTLIDSKEEIGPDQFPPKNFYEAYFTMEKPGTAYSYFKIEIEACVGNNPYMQMSEFFFGDENLLKDMRTEKYTNYGKFEFPETFQFALKDEYEALNKKLRLVKKIDDFVSYCAQLDDLQAQINASGEAYESYKAAVANVQAAASNLNDEGKAKVAAYTSDEEIAPDPMPQPAGCWTFDNPDNLLEGIGASAITAVKFGSVTTPVEPAVIGIVPIAGPAEGNGAVAVPVESYFRLATNTGLEQTTSYSILYDVMSEGFGKYTALLQCDPTNTNDAGLFFKGNQLGRGGVFSYNGEFQTNTWYRILFVMDGDKAYLYVNGEFLTDNTAGNPKELFTMGKEALLFADEDGEETAINVAEIRFYDKALGAEDAKKLGGVGEGAPAEFPNGNYKYIVNHGELTAGGVNAESANVSKWIETYASGNLADGALEGIGYTALAGVEGFNERENYPSLVDGDDATKWCSNKGNYWIVIKTSEAVAANSYRLFTSGDTGSYPQRNWSTWKVFGANFDSDDAATKDAEGWVLLDSKQNYTLPAESNKAVFVYMSTPSTTPYQYYKIELDKSDLMQMSEFTLLNQANFYKMRQDYVAEFEAIDLLAPTQQSLIPPFLTAIEELKAVTTLNDLGPAYNKCAGLAEGILAGNEAYAALTELIQTVGDDAPETIKQYAAEKSAPGEKFANGSYPYIIETQLLSADDIYGEIDYVQGYLDAAANGSFIILDGNTAWGDGEYWGKLVDGDLTTKWGGGRPDEGSFLIFKSLKGLAPYFYTLVTGNDTGNSPDRNWADWKIYAANFASDIDAARNADGWFEIASEEGIGQDRLPGANFAHAHFDFSATPVAQEYTYFRIEVPKSFNNGGNIQMTELIFKTAEDFAALKEEVKGNLMNKLAEMGANAQAFVENSAEAQGVVAAIDAAETVAALLAAQAQGEELIKALNAPEMANGYYQIGTPEQLQWLTTAMNYGFTAAKAKLTADLDMGGKLNDNGEPAEDSPLFTPIGSTEAPFIGEFDGQGHVIKNLVINTGADYTGLFGRIAAGAVIKNFIVDAGSYIGGNAFVGVIGASMGSGTIIIDRIGMEGKTVAGAQNAGGIYGCNMGNPSATVSNCYVTGDVIGARESGQINGWLGGGRIENCWAIGNVEGVYNQTEGAGDGFYRGGPTVGGVLYSNTLYRNATTQPFVEEDARSGKMTYALNGNSADGAWFQNIGEDPLPTLDATHKKVYAQPSEGFRCDGTPLGEISYTNDVVTPEIPAHEYEGFICKNCGSVDPNFITPDGDVYPLSNVQEMAWFAAMVNGGNLAIKGKLTADIDMEGTLENGEPATLSPFTPIGNQNATYKGTFDGQGHYIKNLVLSGGDYTGLFGTVTGGAVIKNFIVDENSYIGGNAFVGIIGGSNGGGDILMENLGMEGKVFATAQNAAGIYGVNMGAAAHPVMKNCYVSGPVIGAREAGQITGYAGNGEAINCLGIGEIVGYYFEDMNDAMLRGNPASTNCYSTVPDKNATVVTEDQIASGEITWALNGESAEGPWRQTIGEDAHPTLDANSKIVVKLGDQFVNMSEMEVVDGFYMIAEPVQLITFANMVNAGESANAKLANDINLDGLTPITIGTAANPFTGIFDGQGYAITGFDLNVAGTDGGLFGQVAGEAEICNFTIDGRLIVHDARNGAIGFAKGSSYIHDITSYLEIYALEGTKITHTAGIVGDAQDNVLVENCAFYGLLTVANYNDCFAGIVGYTNTARIQNCLFAGAIEYADPNGYVGGICGYINNEANPGIANCLSVGSVVYSGEGEPNYGGAIVGRLRKWNASTMETCYYLEGTTPKGGSGDKTEEKFVAVNGDDLTTGKIAAALAGPWRQNIAGGDNFPVLDKTHGYVKEITEAGYATLYLPEAVEIPAGIIAHTGKVVDDLLWIRPLATSIIWQNYAVVLKGAPGYYSFIPVEPEGAGMVYNELLGTDEPLEADGSQYVLAQKDGVIGFYQAEGTIPAGKAYLIGANGVKGFVFSFDGETGIANIENAAEKAEIFDLSGRRIEKAQKGIYIINGKKVLVK